MQASIFLKVFFVLFVFVPYAIVNAQDKTSEIDRIFSWSTPTTPGCVCAVSKDGKLVANRAYGSADLEREVPLTPNAVFDIGSVRKQFIAASVLLLVQDGRLSLSDDIRKYFPELPDFGHKITIDHLLTHTSGLRDWTALMPLTGKNAAVLPMILRQRSINFIPGDEFSYSNSSYVLLTELINRASGMSFADFARKRMFEPLEMKSTFYKEEMFDVIRNRALAYQKEGNNWKMDILFGHERGRGSGAILSTASDLMIWNNALANQKLSAFVSQKIQEPAKLNNGRKLTYARGLNVNHYPGTTLISHSGGANSYSAWLGFSPEHKLSVAVLCNTDIMGTSELAQRVADLFLPSVTAKDPAPVAIPGVDVSGRAGLYIDEQTGQLLRLVINRGNLTIPGGTVLIPTSQQQFLPQRSNLFFCSQDKFEINFRSQDEFELKSMEGQVTRYLRVSPYTPTRDELKAFAGRYESDEIGSIFQIVPVKNGIEMRFEISPDVSLPLNPLKRDGFEFGGRITLHFQRDKSGKIVAFNYSNPSARNIIFKRLGDLSPAVLTNPVTDAPAATSPQQIPKLEALVGEYELTAERTLTITLDNGQLYGQPAGNTKMLLVHSSGVTFAVGSADAKLTLTFELNDQGMATGAVMNQNGKVRVLKKIR